MLYLNSTNICEVLDEIRLIYNFFIEKPLACCNKRKLKRTAKLGLLGVGHFYLRSLSSVGTDVIHISYCKLL